MSTSRGVTTGILFEDRRPNANADPYHVTTLLTRTICEALTPIRAPRRRIGPLTSSNVERPCFRYHSRYTLNQLVPRRAKACQGVP